MFDFKLVRLYLNLIFSTNQGWSIWNEFKPMFTSWI